MACHETIEPLFTEVEAAKRFRIKPRSLRTEREAGRIGYKRVAGRIMYRQSDLVLWQQEGVTPCLGQTSGRASSVSGSAAGGGPSTTSAGASTDARASVARAKAISDQLKKPLPDGSSITDGGAPPAPVVPLRPE